MIHDRLCDLGCLCGGSSHTDEVNEKKMLACGDVTHGGFPCRLIAFGPFLLALFVNFREITCAKITATQNGTMYEAFKFMINYR